MPSYASQIHHHHHHKPQPAVHRCPRQFVGFDLLHKPGLDHALLSPRSVSETIPSYGVALVAVQDKPATTNCVKSGLEPLLASSRCIMDKRLTTQGAGLRIVAGMHNEEDQYKDSSCSADFMAGSTPKRSHPIRIVHNHLQQTSHMGFMDSSSQVVEDLSPHRVLECRETQVPGTGSHKGSHESIFLATSPTSTCNENLPMNDFLSACFFCKRHLGLGKDIFMYRGDRAFCSAECRYQQIVVDERKEGCSGAAVLQTRASNHRNMVTAGGM